MMRLSSGFKKQVDTALADQAQEIPSPPISMGKRLVGYILNAIDTVGALIVHCQLPTNSKVEQKTIQSTLDPSQKDWLLKTTESAALEDTFGKPLLLKEGQGTISIDPTQTPNDPRITPDQRVNDITQDELARAPIEKFHSPKNFVAYISEMQPEISGARVVFGLPQFVHAIHFESTVPMLHVIECWR
jgi:hypothetical protein